MYYTTNSHMACEIMNHPSRVCCQKIPFCGLLHVYVILVMLTPCYTLALSLKLQNGSALINKIMSFVMAYYVACSDLPIFAYLVICLAAQEFMETIMKESK